MELLLLVAMATGSDGGAALSVWNHSAGPHTSQHSPSIQRVVPSLNFTFDGSSPFSAEATATLTVPYGNYSFSMEAVGIGVIAMVWVDGHLVARYAPSGIFLSGE